MTNPYDHIATAISNLNLAFTTHGLKPPSVVLMNSRDDGMKLASVLTRHHGIEPRVIEADGETTYHELEYAGMKFRWPAY